MGNNSFENAGKSSAEKIDDTIDRVSMKEKHTFYLVGETGENTSNIIRYVVPYIVAIVAMFMLYHI